MNNVKRLLKLILDPVTLFVVLCIFLMITAITQDVRAIKADIQNSKIMDIEKGSN